MNEQKLQLVTFEQAKRLKQLGYDWECYSRYWYDGELREEIHKSNWNDEEKNDHSYISAPAVALALKWIRDIKNIPYHIITNINEDGNLLDYEFHYSWYTVYTGFYFTYEAAERDLLDELLKFLENQDKVLRFWIKGQMKPDRPYWI